MSLKIASISVLIGLITITTNSCDNSSEKSTLLFDIVQNIEADSVIVPPNILICTDLFTTQDMLVVYGRTNDTLFSFWSLPECKYLFSAGFKGQGPNDFIELEPNFVSTPAGFKACELNTYQIKEIKVDPTGLFEVIKSQNIQTDKEWSLNRFLFLENNTFCYTPFMGEYEYILIKENGKSEPFGDYPTHLLQTEEKTLSNYNKMTVASPKGDKFAAFYVYAKALRIFSSGGKLLKEVAIETKEKQKKETRTMYYTYRPRVTEKHIYALITENNKDFLEIWDWDGNPIIKYALDKRITDFTISERHNKIYALNANKEGVIYTFQLPTF